MVLIYRVRIKTEKKNFETSCTSLRAVYEALSDFIMTFNVNMELDELFEDIAKLSSDEFLDRETNWYYVGKVIEIK